MGVRGLRCWGFLGALVFLWGTAKADSAADQRTLNVARSFIELYNTIREKYMDPLPDRGLLVGALRGMLSNLDPYSRYLSVAEMSSLMARTEGATVGIGMEIGLDMDPEGASLVITRVEPGGPADKAGLFEGMPIRQVGKTSFPSPQTEESLTAARQGLQGKTGSSVNLRAEDPMTGRAKAYKLVRGSVVSFQTFAYAYPKSPGLCFWVLTHLSSQSPEQSAQALGQKDLKSCKTWVLDLRGNEGGDLDGTRGVLSHFYPKDAPLYQLQKGPEHATETIKSLGLKPVFPLPALILVDEKTASGAELIAQNLSREKGVLTAGPNTVGKALVQQILTLEGGDGFTLTVGRYSDLGGETVGARGVRPPAMVTWAPVTHPSEAYANAARGLLRMVEGQPAVEPPDPGDGFFERADEWLLARGLSFDQQDAGQRTALWRAVRLAWALRHGLHHQAQGILGEEDPSMNLIAGLAGAMSLASFKEPLDLAGFQEQVGQNPLTAGCKDLKQDKVCLLFLIGVAARQWDAIPAMPQLALSTLTELGQYESVLRLAALLQRRVQPDFFLQSASAGPVIESALSLREAEIADGFLRPLMEGTKPTPEQWYWDGVVGLLKQNRARLDNAIAQLAGNERLLSGLYLIVARESKTLGNTEQQVWALGHLDPGTLDPETAKEVHVALANLYLAKGDCAHSLEQLKALAGSSALNDDQKEPFLGELLKTSLRCHAKPEGLDAARQILDRSKNLEFLSLARRALGKWR